MRVIVSITVVGLLAIFAGRVEAQFVFRNSTLGKALITSADAPPGSEVAKVGMNVLDVETTFSNIALGIESKMDLGNGIQVDLGRSTTLDRKLEINDHRGDKLISRGLERTWVASVGLSLHGQN